MSEPGALRAFGRRRVRQVRRVRRGKRRSDAVSAKHFRRATKRHGGRSRRRSTSAGSSGLLGSASRRSASRWCAKHARARPRGACRLAAPAWRRSSSRTRVRASPWSPPGERSRRARAAPLRMPWERHWSRGAHCHAQVTEIALGDRCVQRWGIRTLGRARGAAGGRHPGAARAAAPSWQAMARGEDVRPLVPTRPEERFDACAGARVADRRARAAVVRADPAARAAVHAARTARSRRRRALHVPAAAWSRARCTPAAGASRRRCATCGRCARSRCSIWNRIRPSAADRSRDRHHRADARPHAAAHVVFARASRRPTQLATLLARLGALMGQDRVGAPGDRRFVSARCVRDEAVRDRSSANRQFRSRATDRTCPIPSHGSASTPPACAGRASRSNTASASASIADRRGFADGRVAFAAGPWRSSRVSGGTMSARARHADRAGTPARSGRGMRRHALADVG